MKKLCIFLCLLLPVLLFTACNGTESQTTTAGSSEEKKEGIELSVGTRMTIGVGEFKQIQAINMKNDSPMTNVIWSSADPTIATVDFSGKVAGIADGETTITAASIDGKYKASCKVSVSSVLMGMTFETPSIELQKGEQTTLKLILTPANLEGIHLTWMTGDPKVATVNNGKVTAVGNGSTSIIVSSDSGLNAVCTVNVVTTVTGITLDTTKLTLHKGESHQFTVSLLPEGASDPGLNWTSSNPSVASVNSRGEVTALTGGTTVITAKTENGKTATCNVSVTSPVTGVSLDREEIVLNVNQADKLIVNILPEDANNRQVIWDSTDLSVVTVSSDGTVMGLKSGTATITVTTVDGYFVASCAVTVKNLVTEMNFGELVLDDLGNPVIPSSDLEQGKTLLLVPTLIPADCEPPVLTWTTSDPAIATVAADGTVLGVGIGEATITVTSDNGVTATYVVRVVELEIPIEKIIVDSMLNLKLGKNSKLNISLLPADTTESYTIVSRNSSIVRVNADGTLVPLKVGMAVIEITSKSGSVTVQCAVYVEELTDYEREEYQKEYDDRKELLNKEHENNLSSIDAKWDSQIKSAQNNLDKHTITTQAEYDKQRKDYESKLQQAESNLNDATAKGDQELIKIYTDEKDVWQKKINELDDNWTLYKLTKTQLDNLNTSKVNEISNENTRYQNALKALADEYSFLN